MPIKLVAVPVLIFLVVIALVTCIYVMNPTIRDDIVKSVIQTLLQLAVIGVVGVYVKFLFDKHQEERKQEVAETERKRQESALSTERERQKEETLGNLRRRMIEKLTSCYHAIFKARISIQANPSVETYDEVVQVIANQQLELVNMKGEAVVTPGLFSESEVIGQNVAKINGYLAELVEEYARSRQGIAQAQIPANLKLGLGNLHHLGDFKNAGNQFIEKVIQPYQTAFREMVKDVWSRRER